MLEIERDVPNDDFYARIIEDLLAGNYMMVKGDSATFPRTTRRLRKAAKKAGITVNIRNAKDNGIPVLVVCNIEARAKNAIHFTLDNVTGKLIRTT